MSAIRTVRKKIGDLLMERHIINAEQLSKALEEQKRKGGYLSQHLIALGFVSDADIATCLSNQYNFAYLPLKNYSIPQEVLEVIPLKWVKIYTLIPVDRIRDLLSISMADPLNEGVIEMLHQVTNCEIQVFISTYGEINEAIDHYYGEKLKELKEAYIDARDLGKCMTATEFIQTRAYKGPERREYIRLEKTLDVSYYYHGRTFQNHSIDVSYGGVAFFSNIFIPIDANLACKIYLEPQKPPIDVVVNTLRAQPKGQSESASDQLKADQLYEIAGSFDFITGEDRERLVGFLKASISE